MIKAIIRSFLVLAVIFAGVACGDSKDLSQSQTQDSQECNFTRESALYNEWAKEWKGQKDGVYYYNSGTPYAIINMLKQCDIKGLRLMLDELGKREFISMQASGGMIFLIVAIESAKVESVQFLLENKLTYKDNVAQYEEFVIDEVYYDKNYVKKAPLQFAHQKLNEAKSSNDSNAVQNYEKIIEILEKYKSGQ